MKFLSELETRLFSIDPAKLDIAALTTILDTQEIVLLLHKAILAGEYIIDDGKKSNTVINRFNLISQKIDDNDAFVKLIPFVEAFAQLRDDSFINLGLFEKGKEGKTIDTRRFQYYRLKTEIYQEIDHTNVLLNNKGLNSALYNVNLLLAYIDEYLECNKNFDYELSSIIQFLKSANFPAPINEIQRLLISKAGYMDFKIKARNALYQKDNPDQEVFLPTSDFVDKVFLEFAARTTLHYKKFPSPPIDEYEAKLPKEEQKFRLEEFHHLNRYIAEYVKNTDLHVERITYYKSRIDGYIDILKKREKAKLLFDRIACQSIINALRTTSYNFSLKIVRKQRYEELIKAMRRYIINTDRDSLSYLSFHLEKARDIGSGENSDLDGVGLKEYYCLIIFLQFHNDLIDYLKDNYNGITDMHRPELDPKEKLGRRRRALEVVDELSSIYKSGLDELNANFDVLLSHRVRSVYLSVDDCQSSFTWENDEPGSLFLHSSYILPNNPSKLKVKIESFSYSIYNQISSLRTSFDIAYARTEINAHDATFNKKVEDVTNNFDTDVKQVKADLQKSVEEGKRIERDLKDKLKENEFKLVQIVAMFVSIATFVLLNVKIFDNKSGIESFAILIGLAGCFFIFNLFFHLVVVSQYEDDKRVAEAMKRIKKLLWIPVGFATVSAVILLIHVGFSTKHITSIDSTLDVNGNSMVKMKNELAQDSAEIDTLRSKISKLSLPSAGNTSNGQSNHP